MKEHTLPVIEHAGVLENLIKTPSYLIDDTVDKAKEYSSYSCGFCGVGDSGILSSVAKTKSNESLLALSLGIGILTFESHGVVLKLQATLSKDGIIKVVTTLLLTPPGSVLSAELAINGEVKKIIAKEVSRELSDTGALCSQSFKMFNAAENTPEDIIINKTPSNGCAKLKLSMLRQKPAFPIHTSLSILEETRGQRQILSYEQAINGDTPVTPLDTPKTRSKPSRVDSSGRIA